MVMAGYKETLVGIVPEDWVVNTIESVSQRVGDVDHRMPKSVDYGIPYIMTGDFFGTNGMNFTNAKKISMEDYHLLSRKIKPEKGDIIFARYASVGAVRYVETEKPFVISYSCVIIKPAASCNAKYLYYIFQSAFIQKQINFAVNTGTQKNVGIESLKLFFLPLPQYFEQTAIATALSDADAYITVLEKLLVKKRAVKQGAMQELLTGKCRLPGFEGEWVEDTYRRLCEFINGRAYAQDELLSEGAYRVLRLGNFFTNDHWYFSNLELPDKQYCDNGDLLYAWSASFGPVLWSGEKVIYHYHIWKTIVSSLVTKNFLYHYMVFDSQSIMGELQGGTMSHLTKEAMESRMCTYPSNKDEQTAITNILSDMDAEINALTANLKKARRIKQGMMSELLMGRIRLIKEDTDNGKN